MSSNTALVTELREGKQSFFSHSVIPVDNKVRIEKRSASAQKLAVALRKSTVKVNKGQQQELAGIPSPAIVEHVPEVPVETPANDNPKIADEGMQKNSHLNEQSIGAVEPTITLNTQTPPRYPYADILQNNEGTVGLEILVNSSGAVVNAEVISSSGFKSLDDSATEAIMNWHYNISDVSSDTKYPLSKQVEIDFQIDDR